MPAINKVKTFLFKHIEKVVLGLAVAGFVYVVVGAVSGKGISAVIIEINDKASRLKKVLENPPDPDPPPIPIPQPIDEVLKAQEAPSAGQNPFAYRQKHTLGAIPAEAKAAAQPVVAGPAPPASVTINATPGINAVRWTRAPGQGATFRVDVFRIQKDRLLEPVPNVISKQNLDRLGFQLVGSQVAANPNGIGVYNDSNILGETPYVYALRSIRVEEVVTEETVSANTQELIAQYIALGFDYNDAYNYATAEPTSVVNTKVEIKVTGTGTQLRTAEIVSAIPVKFALVNVREDESGEPVGKVHVERLIGGQWHGYNFDVRQGELIGDYKDIRIRPKSGKPYSESVDLRTKATCIRFEQFEETYTRQIKNKTITGTRPSWKMIYTDKDGNTRETKKQIPKRGN